MLATSLPPAYTHVQSLAHICRHARNHAYTHTSTHTQSHTHTRTHTHIRAHTHALTRPMSLAHQESFRGLQQGGADMHKLCGGLGGRARDGGRRGGGGDARLGARLWRGL
jgi:hypothetical protein